MDLQVTAVDLPVATAVAATAVSPVALVATAASSPVVTEVVATVDSRAVVAATAASRVTARVAATVARLVTVVSSVRSADSRGIQYTDVLPCSRWLRWSAGWLLSASSNRGPFGSVLRG